MRTFHVEPPTTTDGLLLLDSREWPSSPLNVESSTWNAVSRHGIPLKFDLFWSIFLLKAMQFPTQFDVIVVGGGHAGTEAALAAARAGCRTLLLTPNIETLGQMSCNPSIGGIGKGHLVKEVDALGGAMAIAADEAGIQFRILNSSKGPPVRATRAQADRLLYKPAIRSPGENPPNLTLFPPAADGLLLAGG